MLSFLLAIIIAVVVLLWVAMLLSRTTDTANRSDKNKNGQPGWMSRLRDAKTVEMILRNPALAQAFIQRLDTETGIPTKLYAGKFDEAVRVYQEFTNADVFAAEKAVLAIAHKLSIAITSRLEDGDIVVHLVADDGVKLKRKIGDAD